jgi:hypothetical protein
MSKKNKINIQKEVMNQIKSEKITMKPKWYFVAGSILMFTSIIILAIVAIFLLNLTIFAIQPHYGPGAEFRLQMILNSFPWWAPIIAIVGVILAIWLIKKYDFSYKKNFLFIILSFIFAVIIGALLMDFLGFNDYFAKRGPMRGFYRQFENTANDNFDPGPRNGQRGKRYEQMNLK